MKSIEQATAALQLLMRRHGATFWEETAPCHIEIRVTIPGRGSPSESRHVTQRMLDAAQGQIDGGELASRGALDFPVQGKVKHGRPKYDPPKVRR